MIENMEEKNMKKEFDRMINNEKNIAHYLMSTPFSTVNNMNYGEALKPEFFEEKFLVYEELEKIENNIREYLDDISQNTVLITGYQGCGKTTFVHYLAQNLKTYYLKNNKKCFIEIVDFEEQDDGNSDNIVEERNPFKRILINRMISEISQYSVNNQDILRVFINGYKDNQSLFGILGTWFYIQDFFNFLIENNGVNYFNSPKLKVELYKLLKHLSYVQILIMWSYLLLCKRFCKKEYDFVDILIFDNIDDIYQDTYTEEFIMGLKKYHELGSRFAARIKLGDGKVRFNLYSNFNLIFCLRDTSAAKFSYHFVNRAVEFFHVDISEKVDRKEVIDRKVAYLVETNNKFLKEKSKIIKCICNDNYTIKRIFPFYNNDYPTAIRSLCKVLDNNGQYAQEYYKLTYNQNNASFHFGAHGIILRLILNSFERQGYFKLIGSYKIDDVDEIEKHDLVDYSIPRIILTYLFNYQKNHKDNFLNNLSDSTIDMRKIFDDFCKIINTVNVADKLEAMYSLHLKKDWNHLLTINAKYEVNSSNINNIFKGYRNGKMYTENDGSIQITCAGKMFVSRITTHYEYFACRYFPNSMPLFLECNLDKVEGRYRFDLNIADVFDRVVQCVEKAYDFDMKIVKRYYKGNTAKFKKSHYLYERNQTHAERIINHNISYIDAYRHYILQRIKNIENKEKMSLVEQNIYNDKEIICKCILDHIKQYTIIMKNYIDKKYFSESAEGLYKQYTNGLKRIGTDYLSEEFISFDIKNQKEVAPLLK